ncbi:IclR family transcriptional regulator [Streptomyces noboritoensis]|uniref:IclR family transcriptional regulator n=1 Tax=Streptomyces noboritoensis TaxID=67337 RepID=A0ABV6T958_9ACTN
MVDRPDSQVADRTGNTLGRGVLEGAFGLLEELAHGGELGLTRLADGAGLPKATAHRLLAQLVAVGAVQRRAGRYRLGPKTFRLGQAWQPAPALREAARRPLRQLAMTITGASVNIAVPDAGRTLIVGGIRGEVDDVFPVHAGALAPHGNAGDRMFAAETPETEPPACCSRTEWKRLVAKAHEQSLAFDYEWPVPDVSCVAAPVRAPSGEIIAGVAAVVLDGRRLPSIAPAVRRAADMVTACVARLPAAKQVQFRSWSVGGSDPLSAER